MSVHHGARHPSQACGQSASSHSNIVIWAFSFGLAPQRDMILASGREASCLGAGI